LFSLLLVCYDSLFVGSLLRLLLSSSGSSSFSLGLLDLDVGLDLDSGNIVYVDRDGSEEGRTGESCRDDRERLDMVEVSSDGGVREEVGVGCLGLRWSSTKSASSQCKLAERGTTHDVRVDSSENGEIGSSQRFTGDKGLGGEVFVDALQMSFCISRCSQSAQRENSP
jgi:hypothetical protein